MQADIVPDLPMDVRLTEAHGGERRITSGIVLHSTRGPTRARAGEAPTATLDREHLVTVAYCLAAEHEVSGHFVVGGTRITRMVPDATIAWHAREHNETHLGIEIAQPSYRPAFVDFQYLAVAEICGRWCWKYGLRPDRVTDSRQNGIIGHEDTEQGRRDKKSDPGPRWDWDHFIPLVHAYLKESELAEPAYRMAGEGIRAFLRDRPSLGVPAKQYYDPHGNEVVITAGSAQHPHGVFVIWRKWLNEIRVASWDRPCVT